MGLSEKLRERKRQKEELKRQEEERKRREEREKVYKTLSDYGTIINWVAFGFLGFLTLMMFVSEPPIDALSEDMSVYKLSNTLPFLFYTLVAYLQLKHRERLPLFKECSVPKSIIAWVIVFFIGISFAVAFESLYSEDYQERYAIYQQEQSLVDEEEQKQQEKEELERELDEERKEMEDNLEAERIELEAERKQLEEERQQLEVEKQQLEDKKKLENEQREKEDEVEKAIILSESNSESNKGSFSIRFINVGQADAALVECNGHYMLIDGGNKDDSDKMYSILKECNIEQLDIVVATHVHEDHIGGIPGALNYAKADLVLCPVKSSDSDVFEDFKKYAKENGGIKVPKAGKEYNLGDAVVQILGVNTVKEDENNSSIVLKIVYEDTSFLFTGDAGRDVEQELIESEVDLSATVLKVGHHGSSESTSHEFLRKVSPDYSIISAGKDNPYEHPTDETLETLSQLGGTVFRTDLQGDIYCTSDGMVVTFATDKEVSQENILLSPTTVKKIEAERQAALEKERQEAEELARQKAEAEKQAALNAQKQTTVYKMTYIGNRNTHKFHYQSCSTLPKESNRVYFDSREAAVNSGYSPCGRCHP